MNLRTPPPLRLRGLAALVTALALTPFATAVQFEFGQGYKGSFDTTLSVGTLLRIDDPDPALYGLTNTFKGVAGQQRSVNADDGNLNYNAGLASFLVKASHDLQVDFKHAGIFARGYYFKDFVNSEGSRNKAALSQEARRLVAEGGELLDAYVYFKPTLGDMPASLRIGQQVLSWGESTFIPNGINSVNPIDVAKLRTPGSELKEALRPLNMVSGSLSLTEDLTLEAFYLLDWDRTRVDPPGTYFSTNDFVAKGGSKVYLGFGAINDRSILGAISRATDNEPGKSGQWGLNFKWLAPNLGNTEFGVYYMNYHSRLPVISARTPTAGVNTTVIGTDTGAILQANTAFMSSLVPAATSAGLPPATALQLLIGASLGAVPTSSVPAALQPLLPTVATVSGQISQREFLVAAATGRYVIEFPEDIHLWGASFNTNLKGIALQGELSYRSNQPLQVDDVELLFAALSPLSPRYGVNNQIGSFGLNTYVPGYGRHKVWTGQLTATKVARGFFGADQSTFLAEAGFVHADIPAKNRLRYDGSGTFVGGDPIYMTASGSNTAGIQPLSEPASAFADTFSWGYQVLARLDYNNVFAGVNMSPLVVFTHDVGGNTPLPLGNFLHGRKSVTIGSEFTFQNAWSFDLRYVNFFGAGRYNLLGDRDYVSCNLKYSF